LLVRRLKKQFKAIELTTMVSLGTQNQQKTVSLPLIIHPSWCTVECCWLAAQSLLLSWKVARRISSLEWTINTRGLDIISKG
jgi:hypothetical protein